MTDKIIDGINVQDCPEWYSLPDSKLYCKISNKGDFTCKSNPYCQFKQLEKLREQNKKYQETINDIKYACECECIEGITGYVVDTSIILYIISELQTKEEK